MKKLRFFLGFVLSIIISLVFFEFFFRFSEVFLPSSVYGESLIGNKFKPNAQISLQTESYNMVQINKYGYLGTPYPTFKKDRLLRIALVGDSYVEGFQVREEFHFRSIMEHELKQLYKNEKIQILNFGRSGFNFASMFIYSKLFVQQFNPDIIIFFVQEGDFYYKAKDIEKFTEVKKQKYFSQESKIKKAEISEFLRNFSYWNFLKGVISSINKMQYKNAVFDKFTYLLVTNENYSSVAKRKLSSIEKSINYEIVKELKKQKLSIIIPIRKINNHEINTIITNLDLIELDSVYNSLIRRKINPFYWKATKMEGHWNQLAHKEIGKFIASHEIITEKVKYIFRRTVN